MAGLRALFKRINLRHLLRRRLRTSLTIAGIAAGVTLVFSITVINATLLSSFRSSIRDLAGDAEIEVAAAGQSGLPADVEERIEEIEGVQAAIPTLRSLARLEGPKSDERTLILGVTPEFISLFPRGGTLPPPEIEGGFGPGGVGVVLSERLARTLGVERGDIVQAETPEGRRALAVTGEVSSGAVGVLNGGNVGVMLLPAAQRTFEREGLIDSVYVVVDPDRSVGDVERALESELGGSAVVGPPGERGQGLERVFGGLGTLLSLAGTVALFVALFVVFNTMSIALAERRQEISMSMAMGATKRQVFGAFLGEAALLGAVSSALGIVMGLFLASALVERALDAYRILPLTGGGPLDLSVAQFVLAAGGGVAVSILGAFVPARRVLAVAPVEALRPHAAYEWESSALGVGRRTSALLGFVGIAVAAALMVAFIAQPDSRWIAIAGVIAGLTGVTFLLPHIVPFGIAVVRVPISLLFGTVGRLSTDALRKNPGRTTFTVAALVLTLGMAIGVGSALGSYQSQVEASAGALIGAPIYVTAESFTGLTSDQPLPGELRADLEAVEGVKYVYPLRFQFLNVRGEQALVYAVSVKEVVEQGAVSEMDAITDDPEGFMNGLEEGGVGISRLMARRTGLDIGDNVALPTPSGRQEFPITGVFDDLVSFDSIYIDHGVYTKLWNDDSADEFGILLEDGANEATVVERLEATVQNAPAIVQTKRQLIDRILEVVEGTFSLGRGIQLAALIVAALTIANTMFTAVFERRWEMSLQRTVGMSGRQLRAMVLLEALAIGLVGGVGGALLGAATGFLMTQAMESQFAWDIPFRAPVVLAVLAVGGGMAIAALAGLLPSRLAVRAPIVEGLRYE